ncbi:uracil-DNA glycosylase [Devosia pacifica]|uniref:Uracil-DNA glycosylase n=1 Tax=Devosia pacifica TaxID=1335967 RepID=A0A918VZT1_9HYPH|nr:uracil-DNA glycosylase [Devosia pacifica]GHA38539.1 uracil-DNA glycosylase [Devosia pacifica]
MSDYPRNAAEFVELVTGLRFEDAFNPYSDLCSDFDRPDAAQIRRHNLEMVLDAAIDRGVESIWVARDLGYRGGRRTGLALTDEAHLAAHADLLGTPPLSRSTNGPMVAERTATVIWQMLIAIRQPVFLWNVFPLHPHVAGDPMSNRCHTRSERLASRHVMVGLIHLLAPRRVLAIGRDAQLALEDLGVTAEKVRHPSYGGQTEFIEGVSAHYGLGLMDKHETLPLFA